MTDRTELDRLTDQHRERELQCEQGKDNSPHRRHEFITPQAPQAFRAAVLVQLGYTLFILGCGPVQE